MKHRTYAILAIVTYQGLPRCVGIGMNLVGSHQPPQTGDTSLVRFSVGLTPRGASWI